MPWIPALGSLMLEHSPSMKKLLFAFLAIFLSLLISLTIVEAALRLIGYSPAYVNPFNAFHKGDKHLGWLAFLVSRRDSRRGFDVLIALNEEGFRRAERKSQPVSGATAVMFLGDSFTWGMESNRGASSQISCKMSWAPG